MANTTCTTATRLPGYASLVVRQVAYHIRLLGRSPRSLLAGVLLPVVILLMHGFDNQGDAGAQRSLVAGLAVLGAVSSSYVTHANSLVIARESGVLRRWQLNPLPPACFFAGKIIATVLAADVSAMVTVLVAAGLGVTTNPIGVAWMLVPLTVGAFVWASISTAVSSFIPNAASAYPLLTLTYLPVVFISGAIGQMAAEPSWMRTLAGLLPVRPVLDAATGALQAGNASAIVDVQNIADLAGWAVVATLASLFTFRWAPQRAS